MSDALDDGRTLDELSAVFAAIDAAQSYGFSVEAAASAAGEQLVALDQRGAVAVAALLAALVAVDLQPADAGDLDRWREAYEFALHCRERPA